MSDVRGTPSIGLEPFTRTFWKSTTMSILRRTVLFVLTLPLAGTLAPYAHAAGALYTMTNAAQGNEVLVFQRDETTGALSFDEAVDTGGRGTGTSLGNQGALVLSEDQRWLLVVNAGSDSVSVLEVTEDGLELTDTIKSGGKKPVSVAIHDDLVAVLNAGGDMGAHDKVALFLLEEDGELVDLHRSTRLSEDATSPAQVGFVQEGTVLVVTEKATNKVDTIPLHMSSLQPLLIVHDSVGLEPFGFALAKRDQILVTEAMTGSVTSYVVGRDGSLGTLDHESTTQLATCWAVSTPGARFAYTTNTMSNTVSSLSVAFDGNLSLLAPSGIAATTGAGPIDAATSPDGHFLYVLAAGTDVINVYHVADDGTLSAVETEGGLVDGTNGLAAR